MESPRRVDGAGVRVVAQVTRPTAAELAHAAHRFHPAEDFFDSLPHALTDRIGWRERHDAWSDEQSGHLFSYLSPEQRVPVVHPLRTIRAMTDDVLRRLSPRFDAIYAATGRPSIPPEHLLRTLLLQVLYSVRSERMLMEQLEYNLLFRWFVRLGMDDDVWAPTTFTNNRDRLL